MVTHVDVMRLECCQWRDLHPCMVNAWKLHADSLNSQPIPGRFYQLPPQVARDLMGNVLEGMTLDWERFVRIMKAAITRPPKRNLSSRVLMFGKERVHLLSQTYRAPYMNLLLRKTIFGIDFKRMRGLEVVYRRKTMLFCTLRR